MALQQLTDDTFNEVVGTAETPMLVDFWAEWCGPCKQIAPVLEELAVEQAGRLQVAKLNVDENVRTTTRYNVRSIPAILFFKGGKVVDSVIGAVPKGTIESKIQQHLN